MNGIKQQYEIQVLYEYDIVAVSDKEKAEMFARNFWKIQTSEKNNKKGKVGDKNTLIENEHL